VTCYRIIYASCSCRRRNYVATCHCAPHCWKSLKVNLKLDLSIFSMLLYNCNFDLDFGDRNITRSVRHVWFYSRWKTFSIVLSYPELLHDLRMIGLSLRNFWRAGRDPGVTTFHLDSYSYWWFNFVWHAAARSYVSSLDLYWRMDSIVLHIHSGCADAGLNSLHWRRIVPRIAQLWHHFLPWQWMTM